MTAESRTQSEPQVRSSELVVPQADQKCAVQIERMERRREWIMEQKQRALECNDMLKAAGWGLRAAGVADAIDILKVVEEEARQNAKLTDGAGK